MRASGAGADPRCPTGNGRLLFLYFDRTRTDRHVVTRRDHSGRARESRRRKNHNFHTPASEAANRLLDAVEPGSYIPPHRHLDPTKDETFVVLRGRFGLVCFDEAGEITRLAVLDPGEEVVGANIPHGTYHTLVSLAAGSVPSRPKLAPTLRLSTRSARSGRRGRVTRRQRTIWPGSNACFADGIGVLQSGMGVGILSELNSWWQHPRVDWSTTLFHFPD